MACDRLSRQDIDAVHGWVCAVGVLPPGFPGAWKAADNTYIALPDKLAWLGFYGAMLQQGTANFAHSQALKATLAAATTPAQVAAIRWNPP